MIYYVRILCFLPCSCFVFFFFFFNDTATTEIYPLSLHDALPISGRGAAAALAIGLVIVEFLPRPAPTSRVEGRPVDTWLAAQPGNGAVVQLPYEENADSQAQIYYTLIHHKPLVGGLYGSFSTRQHNTLREPLGSYPSAGSAQQLRDLGVGYVMVDVAWYEARDLM